MHNLRIIYKLNNHSKDNTRQFRSCLIANATWAILSLVQRAERMMVLTQYRLEGDGFLELPIATATAAFEEILKRMDHMFFAVQTDPYLSTVGMYLYTQTPTYVYV
jgi:hypothetical protein